MAEGGLNERQRRFIGDMAALMTPWGMSPALAGIYAYLMLAEEPASLDEIAGRLNLAKSSVSTATRALERYGLARRYSQAGSKRVRYSASETHSGFLLSQATLMAEIGRLAESRADEAAQGKAALRIRHIGSFYTKMARTIVERVDALADEHARASGMIGRRGHSRRLP